MRRFLVLLICIGVALAPFEGSAQRKKKKSTEAKQEKIALDAFKFRNVGPAFLSGRIADIVFHPENDNIWYVAVGSGGVWKTENAGTTWTPLFDQQASYSTGCISLDPQNPSTVWVGTGENVGGRHVAYGDGIYRSKDGGKNWENLGLKGTEHISKIIIHPNTADVVWVAAQGPLWNKGGERGVYKPPMEEKLETSLGRFSLDKNQLIIDPRNPQVLCAATWDCHRRCFNEWWTRFRYINRWMAENLGRTHPGLPSSNMGKI